MTRRRVRIAMQGRLRRLLVLAAAAAGLAAPPVAAQTIRPVVVQYVGNRVKAKFELVNDTLFPLNVILEPKSFDVTETGEAVYRPLDPSIHLRLSAMSLRIPAKQSRFIFFEATVDSLPSWFVIPCTFAGMPKHGGLDIEVELPHTVYMLQKQPLRREDVQIPTAVYSPAEKGILVEVENTSPGLGRVLSAEAIAKGQKRIQPSFPLLPHGVRQFVIPWDLPDPPEKLILHFNGFDIERPLLEASQVAG
jgi:hypothetical protein